MTYTLAVVTESGRKIKSTNKTISPNEIVRNLHHVFTIKVGFLSTKKKAIVFNCAIRHPLSNSTTEMSSQ